MERTEEHPPWHDDAEDAELTARRLRNGDEVHLWAWFHGRHYRRAGSPDEMYGVKAEDSTSEK